MYIKAHILCITFSYFKSTGYKVCCSYMGAQFPSEGNFYATSSRGRYGNASSVTGYLKHD